MLIPLLMACNTTHQQTIASTMPRPDDSAARVESGLLPSVLVKGEPRRWTLAAHMREYRIPAVSIAVINNYRVEWARAYGMADVSTAAPATVDTLFQAGSISKPVAAMAALLAVAHGSFALDAPINDALTTWKLPDNELTRAAPVTLRRLLSHTAGTTVHGFPGYAAGAPLPTLSQVLDGQPPANTPPVRVDLAPATKFR
jgi:CubicO group peptidase (beta-lactamase class C family)